MTEEQQKFISELKSLISYWDGQPGTCKIKMEGLVFSILVILDGRTNIGPYSLRPIVEDEEGEDIAGSLHDLFYDGIPAK